MTVNTTVIFNSNHNDCFWIVNLEDNKLFIVKMMHLMAYITYHTKTPTAIWTTHEYNRIRET